MSQIEKDIKLLESFNKWRRGSDELKMPNPKELGLCIERTIINLKKLNNELIKTKTNLQ